MLNTLSELYGLGVIHGDVTPHSILVHRHANNLYFKLNNVQQMTGFNQYKRALLEAEDCRWHLAPELLDSLAKRELRPQYDCQKSDVYSLGLTVLEMGTGKIGLGGLYDLDTITVNESTNIVINLGVLEALLERFSSIHG
jgi:serine/threonine protein kinase